MKYLIIFLLIMSLILTILIVRQNREIKDLRSQVNKCKVDILQWSKLSQYADEFHAIPDPTAPLQPVLRLRAVDWDTSYPGKLEIRNANENKTRNSTIGNNPDTSSYKDFGPDDRMWPDDRREETKATKVIPDTNKFGVVWCIDERGNETRYKLVDGKLILQKD